MEKPKKENPEAIADLFFDMVQSQKENNKNLIRISIITTVCFTMLLITMVIGFFVYESQFDVVDTGYDYQYDYEQEAEAGDNGTAIVNGNGDIRYVEGEDKEQHQSDGQDED